MLACLIWLIIYCIAAVIVVYVIETLLSLFVTMPPQIPILIRCLAALLVLIGVVNCLGLLPHGALSLR